MTVATFIARMRTRQALLFDSTGALTRHSSAAWQLDPDTARETPPAPDEVYAGAALVRPEGDQVAEVGEGTTALDSYIVKLPPNTDARIGDTWTTTASTYDEGLVDVPLRVVHVFLDEWQIARKVRAVAQTPRPT